MTEASWASSWAAGLLLIVLTSMVHSVAVVALAIRLQHVAVGEARRHVVRRKVRLLIGVVLGWVALVLVVLHGLEAAAWAVAYLAMGATSSFHGAMLFSLDSMTTRGAIGANLPLSWQLMGSLEAADGMLLFGISTAFMYAVLRRIMMLVAPPAETPNG